MGSFGNVEVIEGRKYLGSFHQDILQAHPTDEASQRNLVEEIKNRASDKSFLDQLQKLRNMPPNAPTPAPKPTSTSTTTTTTCSKSSPASTQLASSKPAAAPARAENDDEVSSNMSNMRGYKKTADG